MIAVRDSVDELEPMIATSTRRSAGSTQARRDAESIEPIGDLAEKIPGNRRRR